MAIWHFKRSLRLWVEGSLTCFFNDRHFRVRLDSTLSDTFSQKMGVPQGSILSVTLFSIKINSIVSCMKRSHPHIEIILYQLSFETHVHNEKAPQAVT
ncbi:hypothetical protein BOW27_11840 [Solemya velum gill symbiont]|nr:hypothetical protein BOW27_11840 [Solemya velum gill symbiont]